MLESLFASRIEQNALPGAIVGWIDGDRSRVEGYGTVSRKNPALPNADTVYEIGSITKVFTGILLADLAERGMVGLEDPVEWHLPAAFRLPRLGERNITLLDLATHTSGLPRLPEDLEDGGNPADPYAHYDADRLRAFLSGYALTRCPGTLYEYSNLGMGLLGFALAYRAGQTYEDLVRTRLCEALDMTGTALMLTPAMRSRWAQGYGEDDAPASPWHLAALAGAGGLRSSVRDLLRFIQANLGENAPELQSALRRAQQRQRPGPNKGAAFLGLGWHTWDEGPVLWHNGGTGGCSTFLAIDRERRQGIVLLTNRGGLDTIGLGRQLLEALMPTTVS